DGFDSWTAFELSWLSPTGIPEQAVLTIEYSCDSQVIIESKSFKLFLGSLNNTRFESPDALKDTIGQDLSKALQTQLARCELILPSEFSKLAIDTVPGRSLDDQPISKIPLKPHPQLIETVYENFISEEFHTNKFRSLCPVTSQPDWATIVIKYSGRDFAKNELLSYLLSFRNSAAFHEQICEQIFCDLTVRLDPQFLAVGCYFLRRGGIDITPHRWTRGKEYSPLAKRLCRQ
ncbi:MAG: hypothetical protein KDD53_03805, partial [Bdellovibrionales bacterium]|nr:hypothetical protein [Bdellovibrionales bacterium]